MSRIYQTLVCLSSGVITLDQYLQIPSYKRESMQYLFSPDGRQAIAEGVITLEQYLQIPLDERKSMQYLFSPDGRQAVADGVITLEQYLQTPLDFWDQRKSMQYLFSPDGRQAIADGVITLEQYLQIPWNERKNVITELQDYCFSYMRQAIANGIITFEQYIQIPNRYSMKYLFSPNVQQAVADGIITFERYLQIPSDERYSMAYLFSPDGRQALADGIITLKRYLQIPSDERKNIEYLFSADGRQAIVDGVITLERYLQIPSNERKNMGYLSSSDGRQAVADGIITLERYLQIPSNERESMKYLFSPNGRQAVADGIITLERYLQIPSNERESIEYLFSPNGRQAIADGAITIEQYLQIPRHGYKRQNVMIALNVPYMRQAFADGIITLEQYLQPRCDERQNVIFALQDPGVQQAIADGVITLARYLQIPWYEHQRAMIALQDPDVRQAIADGVISLERYLQIPSNERKNAMTALLDPHMRQRIINGQIAIENIIGTDPARHYADVVAFAAPNINNTQSTHTTSVHQSVSESATRLANLYKSRINGACLESTIGKAQTYINNLPDDSEKNTAAKRGFLRIVAPDYTFTDPKSQISIKQLLALVYLAIHDDENRTSSLEDAETQFVEALYEIQREYNLSKSGIDLGGQEDQYTCSAGAFNKFIEKLVGIHPECRVLFITRETASFKLPIVVREEAMRYLTTFANLNTAEALSSFTHLITQVKKDGVEVIWEHIRNNIATRMFDEFGRLYRNRADPDFTALIEAGKYEELKDLNTFQEQIQKGYLSKHKADGAESQKEDVINPEKLIYTQIEMQLAKLENKAKSLRAYDHILAYCKATNIVLILRDLNRDYFLEKKIDYKTYKEKSFDIINQQRPELDKHRGYKQVLGNLLILIATLGIGQLLNKACTGNFLFFKTDSAKHIDTLSNMIEKMEFTCPSRGVS
ncbi:hypothetical protein [Rickettsiella endosymbiont of Dermanyssus gallinae]|uniref:hypothetical protein n=1 Tax=Rickettsiella endosymbiont of Dermanyssus gallinae TaxID=2856608 RepID=UPI001C5305C9|nr:hypothetical protein [Rickettsiella endosymbiont of Dermanyssus gallinae]